MNISRAIVGAGGYSRWTLVMLNLTVLPVNLAARKFVTKQGPLTQECIPATRKLPSATEEIDTFLLLTDRSDRLHAIGHLVMSFTQPLNINYLQALHRCTNKNTVLCDAWY